MPSEDETALSIPREGAQRRLTLRAAPRRGFFRRAAMVLGALIVLGLLVAGGTALFLFHKYSADLPDLPVVSDYRPPIISKLWSADRVLAGELYDERRVVLPYERIPRRLIQAFIAAEDKRFFDHQGFDPLGMLRAAFKTYVLRGRVQGGSSLTQQTAKAMLVSAELTRISEDDVAEEVRRRLEPKGLADDPEAVRAESLVVSDMLRRDAHARGTKRDAARKIRELILAVRLEGKLSKEEILYLYLNNVYLGHHSYGVAAAAENYFRKDVSDLTLGEIAYLAALPQAPTRFSPWANPAAAKARRSYVLTRMLEDGMITEAERAAAEAETPTIYPVEDRFHDFSPFYTEQVRRDLVARYGNERMLLDGLDVTFTMDGERQRVAQDAILDGLVSVDKRQGYGGPLGNLAGASERRDFERSVAEKLGDEKLTAGRWYVGLVESIDDAGNYAVVNVGGQKAKMPILGMRWARPINPRANWQWTQIDHVKKAVAPGDVVVVRGVEREELVTKKAEPRFARLVPAKGPFVTLEQVPKLQGALVSVDPARRYVVAMVGGYDFDASEFNRVYQACRQPGSSFKPIVYAGAIELLGWQPFHLLVDAPMVFGWWKPNNSGREFKGDVILQNALVHSMNIPAVKTLEALGVETGAEWARQLGISTPINLDLSMALGGSCVQPAELVNVYASFNQGGVRVRPTMIRQVRDRFGRILEDRTAHDDPYATFADRVAGGYRKLVEIPERTMSPETAFIVTNMLRGVVQYGTGYAAKEVGKPAAGKTGTTSESNDTWFMGFTQSLVSGVWLGYDRNELQLGVYETGGRASLPIWVQYMKDALGDRPEKEFSQPPGLKIGWATVDPTTGLIANAATEKPVSVPYVIGHDPSESPDPGQADPSKFLYDTGPEEAPEETP